jgi:hypothetical protein
MATKAVKKELLNDDIKVGEGRIKLMNCAKLENSFCEIDMRLRLVSV